MRPITIIVPTLERSSTLRGALETCVCQKDPALEIIVSDNFSQDDTKQVVESFIKRDNRIKYINPGARLGMSEHWEFALDHIEDGFVIVLGDDDGLLPNAIPLIREQIEKHSWLKAIQWSYCTYYYPDLPNWPGRYRLPSGSLGISVKPGIEIRNSSKWLKYVLDCETNYCDLPGIYHGVVDMSLLKDLKRKTGRYICSVTPDVYLGIAIAPNIDKFLHFNQPLSVFGISPKSNGFSQTTVGEHTRDIPKLHLSDSNIKFHEKVAYLPYLPVFTIEAILQAQEAGCAENYPINWKNYLELTHCELSSVTFEDESEKRMRFAALKQICENFGYQKLFDDLEQNPVDFSWSNWQGRSFDSVLDLRKFSFSTIYEVCQFVDTLLELATSYSKNLENDRKNRILNTMIPKSLRSKFSTKLHGLGVDIAHGAYRVYFHAYHSYLNLKNSLNTKADKTNDETQREKKESIELVGSQK